MYCPKCGIYYSEGLTYCDKCGSKLRDETDERNDTVSKKSFKQMAMITISFSTVIFFMSVIALFMCDIITVNNSRYISLEAIVWVVLCVTSAAIALTTAAKAR